MGDRLQREFRVGLRRAWILGLDSNTLFSRQRGGIGGFEQGSPNSVLFFGEKSNNTNLVASCVSPCATYRFIHALILSFREPLRLECEPHFTEEETEAYRRSHSFPPMFNNRCFKCENHL